MNKGKRIISLLLSFVLAFSFLSASSIAFAEEPTSELETEIAETTETTDDRRAELEGAAQTIGSELKDFLTSEETILGVANAINTATMFTQKILGEKKSGDVGAFEQKVNAFTGNLKTKDPSPETLAAYEEVLAAYTALSESQKAQVNIFHENKFYVMVLNKEAYALNAGGKTLKESYAEAEVKANQVVAHAAPFITEAKELYAKILDKKSALTSDEKIDAFAQASYEARCYVGLYNTTYAVFSNEMNSSYCGKGFTQLVVAVGKDLMGTDKFEGKAPSRVTKPNASNYEGGEENPEYKADFNKWLAYKKEDAKYNADKNNHTSKYQLMAWEKIAERVPEYAPILPILQESLTAIAEFEKDSSKLNLAKDAAKKIDGLTDFQKLFITLNKDIIINSEPKDKGTDWECVKWTSIKIYDTVTSIAKFDKLTAFVSIIEGMKAPYDSEMIKKAKESYERVPLYLRIKIPKEIKAKYNEILASVTFDKPSLEQPDLSVYIKTNVTYPKRVTPEQVEKALPKIEEFIANTVLPAVGVKDGLSQTIKNGVFTNATVAEICKMLYPMIGGLNVLLEPSTTPKALAKTLFEDKYAKAVEKLNSTNNDITKVAFENGDMGFTDGDKEGFLDAVSALFRPITLISVVFQFENKIDTKNGTYTYGVYENLVPLFEMLDLKGYVSSHDYTLYVNKIDEDYKDLSSTVRGQLKMQARVRPILVPIINLIERFGNAPFDTLLDFLPKLGHALRTNTVHNQIKKLLDAGSIFGKPLGISVDLTTGSIFNMVAPKLENIQVNGQTLSIKLNKDNFIKFVNDVGGCGDAVSKPSVARGTAFRLGIDSDKPDAFVVLFRWLYGEITSNDNINSIKTFIDGSDMGFIQKGLIKVALSTISKISPDTAMGMVINLLAPPIPEKDPDEPAPENPDNPQSPENPQKPNEEGTTDTNNPNGDGEAQQDSDSTNDTENIPETTGKSKISKVIDSVLIVASAGMILSVAGVAISKRKKYEEV